MEVTRWVQRFLLYLRAERNASPHTVRAYKHDLEEFLAFLNRKYPNTSLERHHRLIVRDYLSELHQKARRRATLLRPVAVLRSFFKFLMRSDLLPQSPFVGLPMPKGEKRLPRYLSEEEMQHLLEIPRQSADRKSK